LPVCLRRRDGPAFEHFRAAKNSIPLFCRDGRKPGTWFLTIPKKPNTIPKGDGKMTEPKKSLPEGARSLLDRAARLIDPGPRPAWPDDETLPVPSASADREANQ
jgi:hypothetical protein